MRLSTQFKWLTGILEAVLGFPFIGATIIISLNWTPLFIMLCLHIVTFVLSNRDKTKLRGSILGIVTSCIGIIPFVGIVMHIITAVVLIKDAKNYSSYEMRNKEKISEIKRLEKIYLANMKPFLKGDHYLATDTNFLMLFHNLLQQLNKETNLRLLIHPLVFRELEGLKLSENRQTASSAQKAFDIIERYQIDKRLDWLPNDDVNRLLSNNGRRKMTSNDEKIVMSIFNAIQNGRNVVFASHDKGARILARELNIPTIEPF